MKVLVTGGAGFVGSHVCEYYAKRHAQVIAIDNLSRAKLLGKKSANTLYNWEYLKSFRSVKRIKGDVCNFELMKEWVSKVDAVIHTAGQTAVTTAVQKPRVDFCTNVVGTFQVLEAVRQAKKPPVIVFCSTNKVYGDNINRVPIKRLAKRYIFSDRSQKAIFEEFGIDLCEHTPYGCSKLAADLYMQDYARLYGLKTGIFRMSCIYGTRQFGVSDQGWLAWFVVAALTGQRVTIYGDGRQVRDVLWVTDLVDVFDRFIKSKHEHGVFNIGGGQHHTLSLLELIDLLKEHGSHLRYSFAKWRPSDQKVYVSELKKVKKLLHWQPRVSPKEGVARLVSWVRNNLSLFKTSHHAQ